MRQVLPKVPTQSNPTDDYSNIYMLTHYDSYFTLLNFCEATVMQNEILRFIFFCVGCSNIHDDKFSATFISLSLFMVLPSLILLIMSLRRCESVMSTLKTNAPIPTHATQRLLDWQFPNFANP